MGVCTYVGALQRASVQAHLVTSDYSKTFHPISSPTTLRTSYIPKHINAHR